MCGPPVFHGPDFEIYPSESLIVSERVYTHLYPSDVMGHNHVAVIVTLLRPF